MEKTTTKASATQPVYEPPKITVMSEADILKAFQVTSAGMTWWVA